MDWRDIENALIEAASEYDLPIEQIAGESFITIGRSRISLEEFAKQLAERLK